MTIEAQQCLATPVGRVHATSSGTHNVRLPENKARDTFPLLLTDNRWTCATTTFDYRPP